MCVCVYSPCIGPRALHILGEYQRTTFLAFGFEICFIFRCMCALLACTSVYYVCAWCPRRPEEGTAFPDTGVTESCKLPGGHWKWHLGLSEEQLVPLTTNSSLLSLQLLKTGACCVA